MESGAFCSVCVCLCPCLSLYGREYAVGYARLRGGVGATFCHLAALFYVEFLFWDHWETAVLGQSLAGRSREVTGGYGQLRREKRRKVEERQEKGRRKPKKMTEMSSLKSVECGVESAV